MRKKKPFNEGWYFQGQDNGTSKNYTITLPHTWNAEDGQDGGNDYYRGTCRYTKKFPCPTLEPGEEAWLEFEGAAMTAEVYLNDRKLARHEGGYSTFRVNITEALMAENLLTILVNNGKNRTVYPQKADFTFYGGLYREVSLIIVPSSHFVLDYYGSPGIKVTPKLSANLKIAEVTVEAWVSGFTKCVKFTVDGKAQDTEIINGYAKCVFMLPEVHLWDAVEDPYLYAARAELETGDAIETTFGCRSIAYDPEKGFLLNGRPYRLCGAARHQDRQGLGSALTKAEHDEDMALMLEIGANTVRLAHYQHSQYFYHLCDKYGMIVWAEIPYITEHMPEGRENTISQMTELIVQNYNHPSIVCWGLSNEITATGGVNDDMVENHKLLNDLCHKLDATRPTTMAHAFMLDFNDPFVMLSDIRSYNLYFGWYLGEAEQNNQWFDDFHAAHPDAVIGLSEYGADANPQYQTSAPERGDWTESYQAVYHEHMLRMWSERPYIWGMHCWNMFDFGADGRNEGGKPGQNQKGLVTFDRKTKKDAFYVYKAYLSKDPFVYLCNRRYQDRLESLTEVKVYSNQPYVELYVDGKKFDKKIGDKIFKFYVPICSQHKIEAKAGNCIDTITIRKVEQIDPTYVKEVSEIINWFDKPEEVMREGYFSIFDSMEDMKKSPAAAVLLEDVMVELKKAYGDVAQDVVMPESLQRQMDKLPLESLLKQGGNTFTPAMVKQLNARLNQIRKT